MNIHHEELLKGKSRDQLLTNQVQRLLMCLDVYLETEHKADELEGPKEFEQEKNFSRLSRWVGVVLYGYLRADAEVERVGA